MIGLALWLFSNNRILAQTIITAAGGNGIGAAANQLRGPHGVFVDGAGNLYVADATNDRIQKFPPNSTSATNGITVAGGNGRGAAPNQLNSPYGISVDGSGNLYIADWANHRIQKFPPNSTSATNGITVAGGNGGGSAANQLRLPFSTTTDDSGNLYVADWANHRIQKFPPNSTSATNGITVAGGNGGYSGANQLDHPSDVFVDIAGRIYVADSSNDRIQLFPSNSTSTTNGTTVASSQLYNPISVFVDGAGTIYVADNFNHRIQQFPPNSTSSTNGITVAGGNGRGSATNQLDSPTDIFGDGLGRIYIADFYNARIQKYIPSPMPDLSLQLYARPTGLYGTTSVTVVVDVVELNEISSSGLITLKITQDSKLPLVLPLDANRIDNRLVNNNVWSLTGPIDGYYVLTTNQPIAAGDKLSVGLTGIFNPGGSSGSLTVSAVLMRNSGGEQRINNNTDADKLDYFQR